MGVLKVCVFFNYKLINSPTCFLSKVFNRKSQGSGFDLPADSNMAAVLSGQAVPVIRCGLRTQHRSCAAPSRSVPCRPCCTTVWGQVRTEHPLRGISIRRLELISLIEFYRIYESCCGVLCWQNTSLRHFVTHIFVWEPGKHYLYRIMKPTMLGIQMLRTVTIS